MIEGDEEKNRLCRPIRYWEQCGDYVTSYLALIASERARATHPALAAWARDSRLNPLSRLGEYSKHPSVMETRELLKNFGAAAMENLPKLVVVSK